MPELNSSRPGLYIHVPFCRRRCKFCDFASTTDLGKIDAFLDSLEAEMDLRAPGWPGTFDTVYLGGGTPSILGPARVSRVLAAVRRRFSVAGDAEVTLEMNPGDLGRDELAAILDAGVSRLSLGVQAFDERDLAFLGRGHTVRESLESFASARSAGFRNLSIDLIYGLPGVPRSRWEAALERAAALAPEHISAYQLTREPGDGAARKLRPLDLEDLSDEESLALFLLTRERLEAAGYRQFEVSSYPRSPELESRHNRKYWEGSPYLGLGPAAHSHRDVTRSWNPPRLEPWAAALASGRDPAEGGEVLGPVERMIEAIFLGLRLVRGLDLGAFEREFGVDLRKVSAPAVALLEEKGYASFEAPFLRLTPAGLAIADEAALRLAGPIETS